MQSYDDRGSHSGGQPDETVRRRPPAGPLFASLLGADAYLGDEETGEYAMRAWVGHVTAFARALAANQAHRIEPAVRAAYAAGAEVRDLLVARHVVQALSPVLPSAIERAAAAIDAGRDHAARPASEA